MHAETENLSTTVTKGTVNISEFTPNENGCYGTVGQSGIAKVRNLPGGNKSAKQFLMN